MENRNDMQNYENMENMIRALMRPASEAASTGAGYLSAADRCAAIFSSEDQASFSAIDRLGRLSAEYGRLADRAVDHLCTRMEQLRDLFSKVIKLTPPDAD